jgi:hypothetical protein
MRRQLPVSLQIERKIQHSPNCGGKAIIRYAATKIGATLEALAGHPHRGGRFCIAVEPYRLTGRLDMMTADQPFDLFASSSKTAANDQV